MSHLQQKEETTCLSPPERYLHFVVSIFKLTTQSKQQLVAFTFTLK